MKTFTKNLSNEGATLTGCIYDNNSGFSKSNIRPAVLVFPGGGYANCSNREADPIAFSYAAEGYNTFILRYSVGEKRTSQNAFDDANEAIALLHKNAEEYLIDKNKIAVIGFSAGGHLAAWVSVLGKIKPAATILGYPCILQNMKEVLNGKELPDICAAVNAETPPAFIFHTRNDGLVPVENSLQYAAALDREKIGFELHVFRDGIHGLSLAKKITSEGNPDLINPDAAQWMKLSVNWLEKIFA